MGRIKSLLVKKTGKLLLNEGVFNTEFENNKLRLKHTMPSKSTRNKVAGYITRMMKAQAAKITAEAAKEAARLAAKQNPQSPMEVQ